jgi:hypothetical protein
MALPKTSRLAIDNLPEAQRKKVISALLSGVPLRTVATLAGISHVQVARYKKKVLLPAIKKADEIQSFQSLSNDTTLALTQRAKLTQEVIACSPFRSQLASLKERTERALDKVERDDKRLALMAPLIAQGHKNVELLGRATGELEQAAGPQIAVQIVIPASQGLPDASSPAADISCSVRGTGRE